MQLVGAYEPLGQPAATFMSSGHMYMQHIRLASQGTTECVFLDTLSLGDLVGS